MHGSRDRMVPDGLREIESDRNRGSGRGVVDVVDAVDESLSRQKVMCHVHRLEEGRSPCERSGGAGGDRIAFTRSDEAERGLGR